jgi:hypothetical protein
MKRWRLLVLIFELTLFAVILVLPQVALPDFTFHDGTAPVAARARVCGRAPGIVIGFAPQMLPSVAISSMRGETSDIPAPPPVHSRLSRLCVLIC